MNDNNTSQLSGFYKLTDQHRLKRIQKFCDLTNEEIKLLNLEGSIPHSEIDKMSENVISHFELPLSIATNFKINGKDYLIPMVTEEPSVVAAASNGAKIARKLGGFKSYPVASHMIAQIQITNLVYVKDQVKLSKYIMENKETLIQLANESDVILDKKGGGAYDINIKRINTKRGEMLILHLFVNVLDAMGANSINTMVEAISKYLLDTEIFKKTTADINLKIVSNLSTERMAECTATFDKTLLGGDRIINRILDAYHFAKNDPYRATTHNKGIMNGIDALCIATGNDFRAVEAGAHGYAATKKPGTYQPLTSFKTDDNGNLIGKIRIPLPMAIIGGITQSHTSAKIALKILKVKTASELSQVAAALGLAQNLSALRALADEGIQQGHMNLHSRKKK